MCFTERLHRSVFLSKRDYGKIGSFLLLVICTEYYQSIRVVCRYISEIPFCLFTVSPQLNYVLENSYCCIFELYMHRYMHRENQPVSFLFEL